MSKIRIASIFKDNMNSFLDFLIGTFPTASELTGAKIYINTMCSDKELIDLFIEYVYPHSSKIKNRDESVFEELKSTDYFGKIVSVWSKSDDRTKDIIWNSFDNFLKFSNKYLTSNK